MLATQCFDNSTTAAATARDTTNCRTRHGVVPAVGCVVLRSLLLLAACLLTSCRGSWPTWHVPLAQSHADVWAHAPAGDPSTPSQLDKQDHTQHLTACACCSDQPGPQTDPSQPAGGKTNDAARPGPTAAALVYRGNDDGEPPAVSRWLGDLPPSAFFGPPVAQDEPWSPPGIAGPWPQDEYVHDGGDIAPPVRVDPNFRVHGLEAGDAIVHFDTLDGRRLVEPSNRVAIYAPRFAAVRKVARPHAHEGHIKAGGVEIPISAAFDERRDFATTSIQQMEPRGQRGMRSPAALERELRGLTADNVQGLLGFRQVFFPYENFQAIRHGVVDNAEKPRLAAAIDAALAWTTKQAVQALMGRELIDVQYGIQGAQQTHRYERLPGKPRMRIIKVASKSEARPGDLVDFTIRFDNIGDEMVGNVTIVDNLPARLEYVPQSAQCNLKANFVTEPNEHDSLTLRWEILDPLDRGQGGIIRFQCRVR